MRHEFIESLITLADIFHEGFTIETDQYGYNIRQCTKHRGYVVSIKTLVTIDYNVEGTVPHIHYTYTNDDFSNDLLIIGGWYDLETKKYYIEKNIILESKSRAIIMAIDLNQKAIFDLQTKKCINLPRTLRLRELAYKVAQNKLQFISEGW